MNKPISSAKATKKLAIRINDEQAETVKRQAKKYGLSQAQYLMMLVEKDVKKTE